MNDMNPMTEQQMWAQLSHEEKNRHLYLRQKALLETFLAKHAISKEQYERM